jgi:hypothetical protein
MIRFFVLHFSTNEATLARSQKETGQRRIPKANHQDRDRKKEECTTVHMQVGESASSGHLHYRPKINTTGPAAGAPRERPPFHHTDLTADTSTALVEGHHPTATLGLSKSRSNYPRLHWQQSRLPSHNSPTLGLTHTTRDGSHLDGFEIAQVVSVGYETSQPHSTNPSTYGKSSEEVPPA